MELREHIDNLASGEFFVLFKKPWGRKLLQKGLSLMTAMTFIRKNEMPLTTCPVKERTIPSTP